MLVIILLGFLSVFFFLLFFLTRKKDEIISELALVPTLGSVIAFVLLGVVTLKLNSESNAQVIRSSTKNEIRILNNRYHELKKSIVSVSEIKSYNEEVEKFQNELDKNKKQLKNPWTSWFVCYAYNEFETDMVKKIEFSITTIYN